MLRSLTPVILGLICVTSIAGWSQVYQRIRGDLTIKGKNFDSTYQLVKGRFYYDRQTKKLVLHLRFPQREVYVFHDTTFYHYIDSAASWHLRRWGRSPFLPSMTPYSMILDGHLSDFGLDRLGFQMGKIERSDGLLISEWKPPAMLRKVIGKIRIATRQGRLFGVVYYDPKDNVLRKEFYEDYRKLGTLWFPHRIVQLQYHHDKEAIQVTTYENVVLDEKQHRHWYDFRVPDSQ